MALNAGVGRSDGRAGGWSGEARRGKAMHRLLPPLSLPVRPPPGPLVLGRQGHALHGTFSLAIEAAVLC